MKCFFPCRSRRRGFTLIEIMVASAILVLIVASIYSIWSSILRGSRAGAKAAESVQRARTAVHAVEDALSTAQMFILNGRYYSFLADTTTDPDFMTLSLVSRLPASYPGGAIFGDLAVRRVTFTVERGPNNLPELVLRQVPVMMATNEVGKEYAIHLAQNVKFFRMEFYDRQLGDWVPEWRNTNQIPATVRIALAIGGPANQPGRAAEIITRVVNVPSTAVLPQYQMAGPAGAAGRFPPPGVNPGNINPPPSDQNSQLQPGDRFPSIITPGGR
jgi:prepilin-type N-terminal cleavage/methylation domain-containing protein